MMSMVEERKLIAYAMERIKSVLPGLSSKPVPPLPKGVKVDLSRVIGALIERIEGVLAGSTEPWNADTVWNAGFIASSPSELDSAARRREERTASDVPFPAEEQLGDDTILSFPTSEQDSAARRWEMSMTDPPSQHNSATEDQASPYKLHFNPASIVAPWRKKCDCCGEEAFFTCFGCCEKLNREELVRFCEECCSQHHVEVEMESHPIFPVMLFVAVGKQITSCYKAAVYRIPLVKRMVDTSPADAVFFEPSDDLREDPFVLPDVLGYLGMPDPARWAVPTDLNRLLGIIKLARTLGVNPIIEHLSSALEIAPDSLKSLKTGVLRKKIRDKLRISKRSSEKDTFSCSFCEGSRILPPLRKPVAVLPCCMMEVHLQCRNAAVRAHMNCPGCGFPLTIEGFIALERAKARREAAAAHVPQAPAPRPPPPRIINWAAVRAAIDEEEVNYRVWEEVTGRYSGWRPG